MENELLTPTQTKTATSYNSWLPLVTTFIASLEEKEVFWLNRLNASNSPNEVKDNQCWLKMCRSQMQDLKDLVKIMDTTQLITEHKLYSEQELQDLQTEAEKEQEHIIDGLIYSPELDKWVDTDEYYKNK